MVLIDQRMANENVDALPVVLCHSCVQRSGMPWLHLAAVVGAVLDEGGRKRLVYLILSNDMNVIVSSLGARLEGGSSRDNNFQLESKTDMTFGSRIHIDYQRRS